MEYNLENKTLTVDGVLINKVILDGRAVTEKAREVLFGEHEGFESTYFRVHHLLVVRSIRAA